MVSKSCNLFFCDLLSYLHPRCRSCPARVFDTDSDTGPSPSHAFEADLAEKLRKLKTHRLNSSGSTDLASLSWICKSLDIVISTQAYVKQALHTGTTSAASACSDKMVKQCVEDSVKMLDACSLLKQSVANADAYVKVAHLALRRLQGLKFENQGDIQRAKHALLLAKRHMQEGILGDKASDAKLAQSKTAGLTQSLQACGSMLRRMGDKLPAPTHCHSLHLEESGMGSSMAALSKIYTVFFLRLLSRVLPPALGSPAACSSSSSTTPLQFSRQPAWNPALIDLQAQLNTELSRISAQRRKQRCGTLLPELYTLNDSLQQILENLPDADVSEKARKDVQGLVHSAILLVDHTQGAMARLFHQLGCISCSIVDIQMTLLGSPLGKGTSFH